MIKIEMHSHTRFSNDGFITAKSFARQCQKKHLDCVCITDHNTMRGAIEFARQVPVKIIVGEEMETGQGDVTGLFLKEEIPPGLGVETTVERIKAQGGIVYLPHPFDEFRKSAVKLKDAEKIKSRIDVIEIFNSRTINRKYNIMASKFAQDNDIAVAVGSDAHHRLELGNAYMQMDDFDGPESFLRSLQCAKYEAKKCCFTLRVYIKALKILTGKN
jgi:hypothetical protein